MVVGIDKILKFNRKCTIVVGLLFAVIFFTLIMVPSQADDDYSINKVSKQIAFDAVNPDATTGAYHDTYFNKVDINHQFIVEDVNIGGGADYTSTQSTDEVNIMLEGHLGGLIEACAVSGNYAFIGKGQDFVVLDISNPASPSVLGKLITSGFVNDISVFGNYAYIVNNNGQLVIVDISNPADPTLVGHYDTPVYPEIGRIPALGVIVSNNYAYIANDLNGLVIVNISNPTMPTLTGIYDTYATKDVTVSGNYAYLAAKNSGLVVVDISDPTDPTFTGRYDTTGSANGVALSGNNIFIAVQGGVPTSISELLILNVNNPTNPSLVGDYEWTGRALSVAVSGNFAYLADSSNGLQIINVSEETNPTFEGNYDAGNTEDITISNNYAYVVNRKMLIIVNISNSTKPVLAGQYDSEGDALGVTISGNDIYVAGLYSGLLIADINNPAVPTHVGNCDIAAEHGFRRGVALSDTYAYVANYDMGLVIVNISNPTNPTITGSYDTVGYAQDVVISGNNAYIAATSNGLLIVNISNPTEPTLIGYNYTISAEDVALSGNYAYIADYLNGILVFNISNPAEPILIGSYDIDGTTRSITVSGDYAYVINSTGLVIVNVSDPTAPVFEGFYNIVIAYDVVVSGKYAYVVNYIGLVIVDISNPTEPTTAGYYNSAGNAKGVAVAGQHAYIADSSNGLVILQMAPFSSGGGGGGGFVSNLILNPGFEYLTQDQPDNWTLSGTASVKDTLSSEGNNSLNINASISGDILFANQTLDTYHVAGKNYTFTFDIARSGGISGDAISFYMNYIDFNATEQSLYVWTPNPNDDSNFWMYHHEQIIPSNAFNITGFEMHTNGTGEYWIDNLSLVIEQTPPSLDLYQNYTLEVINIDYNGLEVWLELDKNGNPVKDIVIQNLSTYEFRNATNNDLIINCTVSYVQFLNNNRSWIVLLEDIWQFSDVDGSVLINGTYNTFFGGEQYHDANVLPSGSAVLDIYESTGDVFSFDIGEVENDFIMVEGDGALKFDQTLNISGNLVDMGAVPIDTVTAAPAAGYVNGSVSPVVGHTYCVNISGKYAKFEVVDVTTKNIRIRWTYQLDRIKTLNITNFKVEPNRHISTNNPAIISAYVSGNNLTNVDFGIVDSYDLVSTNKTILNFYVNESGVNGQYITPTWNANAWRITNDSVQENITTIYLSDLPDKVMVACTFKRNDTANEEPAGIVFNVTTGKLDNVYSDNSNEILTIEDGISVFVVSNLKFSHGINSPPTFENGITYTLFSIGSTENPYLVQQPIPTGKYEIFVHAVDEENDDGIFSEIEVDNTPPTIKSVSLNENMVKIGDTISLEVNATDDISNDLTVIVHGINETGVETGNSTLEKIEPSLDLYGFNMIIDEDHPEGIMTFNISVSDEAKNIVYNDSLILTIDMTPPEIISVTLNDTVVQTGAPIEVTVNATDDNEVSVTADGTLLTLAGEYYVGTITAGTSPVTVIVTDEAGNLAKDTSATYTIDDTKPELILELITEGNISTLHINSSEPLSNCTVNYTKCTNSSSENWSKILNNGTHTIIATDFADNVAQRNLTLEIGTIKQTSNNQTNYTYGNVTLNITTTLYVNDSNITICEYDENPVGSLNATTVSLLGINKFVQIEVDSELNESIGTVRISINYSGADLSEIDEDSLKLYVWNASIEKWEELEPSGIDKVKMIVWGELNHLSFFSILGEEPEDVQDDDDNGASSGGGGGGASGEPYDNIACSETDRQYVNQNSDISYSFELECNIVQFVKFTSLKSAGKIATKVEILKDTSALVDNPPSDIVYKNLNIWVGNAGWGTKRNIADATVVFTVDKSWITENNIDESSIALYRYSDDTWHKLVTKKIAEDANSLQFEAETPGFSPFAVTGKTKGEPGGEGIIEPTVIAEKTPAPTPTEEKGMPGFGLFAGLSVLLIAVQLLRKKE